MRWEVSLQSGFSGRGIEKYRYDYCLSILEPWGYVALILGGGCECLSDSVLRVSALFTVG